MDDIDKIRLACHRALSIDTLYPKKTNDVNYANIGFVFIMKQLGYYDVFTEKNAFSPLLINEIYDVLSKKFSKVDIDKCEEWVCSGDIYVAIDNNIKSWNVCVVYPTKDILYTNKFKKNVVLVASFYPVLCITSIDNAFKRIPEIFKVGKPC